MLQESLDTVGMLDEAIALHKKGLRLIPLVGKRAVVKDWPSLHLGESDIVSMDRRGIRNWGILTGDPIVVLDTDTEEAEAWVRKQGIDSTVVVQTGGGGFHRYFRSTEHDDVHSRSAMHGIEGLDVKAWHSYIVAAGSIHPQTGKRYEYLPGREITEVHLLPEFDPRWSRSVRREPDVKQRTERISAVNGHIRDVRAYVRGIQSISHHGGDRACFTVACLLAEAGLSFSDALYEISDWNQTNAFPPWPVTELERKLRYAFARTLRA